MPVWLWTLLLLISLVLSLIMYGIAQGVIFITSQPLAQCLVGVVVPVMMIGLYMLFVKWFEDINARDIPFNRLAQDTAKGFGVGFGFFVAVVLIMMLLGLYHIDSIGTDKPMQIISAFFLFLLV